MKKKEKDILNLLSKTYTYQLLQSMDRSPRRFRDLSDACQNEKMRTQRLREFENFDLIKVHAKRIEGRAVSLYELSETGRATLKFAEDIKRLQKSKP
jgi:DNA-binding HxlR family transcriptional regulator